ncbi:hypothetical protein EON65_07135 [archaeon]|nr:MAG: hypothetical protein EON65_07135 [archaeon]
MVLNGNAVVADDQESWLQHLYMHTEGIARRRKDICLSSTLNQSLEIPHLPVEHYEHLAVR